MNDLNQRFDDMRDLWRAELRRVEEVFDARLKTSGGKMTNLNERIEALEMHRDELNAATAAIIRSMESHIETLLLYKDGGCEPGSFTRTLLEGDVFMAIRRADVNTRQLLGDIVLWIVQNMPLGSYGSRAKVDSWIKMRRQEEAAKHG
jgi:hypothetical protein